MNSSSLRNTTPHSSNSEYLGDFIESAPVAIRIADPNGIILYANNDELEMLGYTKEEYFGKHFADFYGDTAKSSDVMVRLINGEKIINQEIQLICKDGSVKHALVSSNAYFENNSCLYIRFFTRDITYLKRTEKLLRFLNTASEDLSITYDIQEALDKITKLIVPEFADWFVINELRDDGLAYLLKMAHVDPEKVKWAEKYRGDHPIDLNDPQPGSVGWVMRKRQPVLVAEITDEIIKNGARDDEQRALLHRLAINSVMMIPMQVKGRVTGVISFMSCNSANRYDEHDFNFAKDFTNRIALTLENARLYQEVKKDIETTLEDSRKKDEFISIASHELKTPLTSLKAFGQVLQLNFEDQKNDNGSALLGKMNKQIDKLSGLVVDLLDVTRIDKGEMVFDMHEFDFNELVHEIAGEMQYLTPSHKITLQLSGIKKIVGDRNRISRVITNLISNAIKYSPSCDEIIVTSHGEDNIAHLCVQDFGIGIPEDQQKQIFKRFFRVQGKNYHTFPGLGLGLYISEEIVKRHGGKMYFESTEGKGSVFCFEIRSIDL